MARGRGNRGDRDDSPDAGGRRRDSDGGGGIFRHATDSLFPQPRQRSTPAAPGPGGRTSTDPSGTPGRQPGGRRTPVNPKQDASVRRSLERENDAADILAGKGYDVRQNPSRQEVAEARRRTGDAGRPESDPDFLVEGRVFDAYSPSATKGVRGVWSEVSDKVGKEQTQRVVVNLQDWQGDLSALRKQFDDWPIEGCREVKAITPEGDIIQIL